ncbi:MAG: SCP2 sterol-binding domain-containing protein [Chloroflexota bacterium]
MTKPTSLKTLNDVFENFTTQVGNGSDFIEHDGILQVKITGKHQESWIIDLTELEAQIYPGQSDDADCTVTLSDEDFLALANAEITPREAFQAGKFQFEGDTGLAPALIKLLKNGG